MLVLVLLVAVVVVEAEEEKEVVVVVGPRRRRRLSCTALCLSSSRGKLVFVNRSGGLWPQPGGAATAPLRGFVRAGSLICLPWGPRVELKGARAGHNVSRGSSYAYAAYWYPNERCCCALAGAKGRQAGCPDGEG